MSDNPYQAPQADISAVNPLISTGTLTETMVFYLKAAAPWLRFMGIMSFIGCGILAVVGIGFIVSGSSIPEIPGMPWFQFFGRGIGFLYLILAVAVFFPARFTYSFGSRIRNFLQSNSEHELELAFKSNKSLWKFNGILTIIYLALVPVGIVLSIVAAVSSAF